MTCVRIWRSDTEREKRGVGGTLQEHRGCCLGGAGVQGAQFELRMKLRKGGFRFPSRKRKHPARKLHQSTACLPWREKPGTEAFEMRLSARSILQDAAHSSPGQAAGSERSAPSPPFLTLTLDPTHSELPMDSKTPTTKAASARPLQVHEVLRGDTSQQVWSKGCEPCSKSAAYPHPSSKAFGGYKPMYVHHGHVSPRPRVLFQKLSWKR